MAIMYEKNGYSLSYILSPLLVKSNNIILNAQPLSFYPSAGDIKIMLQNLVENNGIDREDIIDELAGRFDTNIIKSTDISVGSDNTEEIYADIVLTDLRSMFIVLRERFTIVVPHNAIKLARQYTQKTLDNIVDDMQNERIFVLLVYLIINAVLLDIYIN
jgi:hypothetical protein